LTKKEGQALPIFERKTFRRIYGPKCENGEWKSPTNRELEGISKGENIGCPKRSSAKNWKGREEGEDPGKDGKRK